MFYYFLFLSIIAILFYLFKIKKNTVERLDNKNTLTNLLTVLKARVDLNTENIKQLKENVNTNSSNITSLQKSTEKTNNIFSEAESEEMTTSQIDTELQSTNFLTY